MYNSVSLDYYKLNHILTIFYILKFVSERTSYFTFASYRDEFCKQEYQILPPVF